MFVADEDNRFDEYPRLKEVIKLKNELIAQNATPAAYLNCDLKNFDLTSLGTKFDVIVIDPPWEEYARRSVYSDGVVWTLEEIRNLKIEAIANNPSFIFLWVSPADALPLTILD